MANQDNTKPTDAPTQSKMDALMLKMGISQDQVNTEQKTERTISDFPHGEILKDKCKNLVNGENKRLGEHIRFTSLKRNGFQKDANGKDVKDTDGKKKPAYDVVTVSGHFVIDKHEDGKYYDVTKVLTHPRSYTIADYTVLSDSD